jgi:hypothetical protein
VKEGATDKEGLSAWLAGFLQALESRKKLGMTETKRIEYLETLEEMLEKFDGGERERLREQIMLLRGWDCSSS